MTPTVLSSGLKVFNATPHPLYFSCNGGEVVVVAPSNGVVNATPMTKAVGGANGYTLNTVEFVPCEEGRATLDAFKELDRDALIVGSIIAAQAYPGEVVAPVPVQSGRFGKPGYDKRQVRSDRFTIFQSNKENANNVC